jgi:hypothetical protein
MPTVFTSWKEIAHHLGKGVRTVQRWEQQLGLPVRRPKNFTRGAVMATAEEIDAWVLNQPQQKSREIMEENQSLREKVVSLEAELERLRKEMASYKAKSASASLKT